MSLSIFIQAGCIFFGIWFTSVSVLRAIKSLNVPPVNFIIMSLAWTIFITLRWLI